MQSVQPTLVHKFVAAFGIILLLAGCSGKKKDDYVERPVAELYNEAQNTMQAGENLEAARLFDEVERQHPYSIWAAKAQLMAAYAYYKGNKYNDAIVALNRYIRLHPSNRDIAYAHYLLALCHYEQISDVVRDQKMTELAMKNLNVIVQRFPNSKYAKDAKVKLDLTNDHLAGKEMEIGRYYLRWRQYLSAINRFRTVIQKFQTTSHVPEALHRLAEAYSALGMKAEARKAAAVLGHNFPGSDWYQDSYALVEEGRTDPQDSGFSLDLFSWDKLWEDEE